jgi:hypothetical protein
MVIAILVGFSYKCCESKSLPGTLIDLYGVWKWCQKMSYETIMISDLGPSEFPPDISSLVAQEKVDIQIMTFREQVNYVCLDHESDAGSQLKQLLRQHLHRRSEAVLFYYTGHGTSGGWLLPDQRIMSWNTLYDLVLEGCSSSTEIFWIMDCCHAGTLSLPYSLSWNVEAEVPSFKENSSGKRMSLATPTILLLNASRTSEKSKSSPYGSLFTRFFVKVMEEMSKSTGPESWELAHLCRSIQKCIQGYGELKTKKINQTLSVYCSRCLTPLLWWWIRSHRPITYDDVMDVIDFSNVKITPA